MTQAAAPHDEPVRPALDARGRLEPSQASGHKSIFLSPSFVPLMFPIPPPRETVCLQVRLRAAACAAFHHDSLLLRSKLGADLNDYFRDLVVLLSRKRGMNKTAKLRERNILRQRLFLASLLVAGTV